MDPSETTWVTRILCGGRRPDEPPAALPWIEGASPGNQRGRFSLSLIYLLGKTTFHMVDTNQLYNKLLADNTEVGVAAAVSASR